MRLNSNCSCLFLPAILVNKPSKHILWYYDDELQKSSDPGGSLFFTAIITGYENTLGGSALALCNVI